MCVEITEESVCLVYMENWKDICIHQKISNGNNKRRVIISLHLGTSRRQTIRRKMEVDLEDETKGEIRDGTVHKESGQRKGMQIE